MKNFAFDNKNAFLTKDDLTGKYLIGSTLDEGYLIVAKTNTLLVDARYFAQSKENLKDAGVSVKLYKTIEDVKEFLLSLGTENLYLDFSKTTVKEFNQYKEFGFNLLDAEKILCEKRAVKTKSQIELIKKACDIAEKAYYSAIKNVKIGISETELKEKIEQKIIEFGGEGSSFDIIVAFNENGAVPHHKTGQTKLKENSSILVDMGAIYNGYMSDITRMAYFGKPSEKFLRVYKEVLKANERAIENIKCGIATDVADGFARESLKKANLDNYFTHSLGHGIGLEIHEYPLLSPRKQDILKENMVFTIEPGVYLDNEFGIRIEDTVLLTNSGVERLFNDDKNLIVIK